MFVKQILLEEVGNVLLQSKVDLLFTIIKIGEGNGNPLQYSCLEKIPWTEEPGRLQSMGSLRVGHD